MKNKIIYGLCLWAAAGILFSSCQEQIVEKFDTKSSLSFFWDKYANNMLGVPQRDSTSFSFFYVASSLTEDQVWIDVRLTGVPSATDQPFKLTQLNAGKPRAAVAGKHYVAFDDPRMLQALVMPAGAIRVAIPVIVKKTSDMESAQFRLEIGFEPTDYFVPGLKTQSKFVVNMTAMAVKPSTWEYYYNLTFGEWGSEKMRFLIDHVGYNDFTIILQDFPDLRTYYNMKARAKLAEYEAANGPLFEKDNVTRVVFP